MGTHFLIISLGKSFPLYFLAIKQPPYGTFCKGHYSAPQQTGISDDYLNVLTSLFSEQLEVIGGSGLMD